MKKLFYLFVFTAFCFGCGNDSINLENQNFSKDLNKRNYQSLSLEDLGELNRNEQIEAANNLSPEKTKSIWMEKIELIINQETNSDYKNELLSLQEFIESFNFDKPFDNTQLIFLDELFAKSINEYDKDLIYMTINFSSFEIYSIGAKHKFLSVEELVGDNDPGCNCRWGACDLAGAFSCKTDSCNSSSAGCGWLLWQSCTKICKSNTVP